MKTHPLPKSRRLQKAQEFAHVFDKRQRAGDDYLLVFAARNDRGQTRFGLSVSKKHGSAVKRTRLKRLLREAFRLSQHELPEGLDLVLIPRQDCGGTLADFQRSLLQLTRKLDRRLSTKERR